ncbi:MAG: FtsX-like permease family protein, partial [Acidobacteriota bacterium]
GSVIRLTAYLYEDEIAVMRMVGATEFFIRGPFYLEGALQGLLGGLVAIACLAIGFGALRERMAGSIGSLITQNFLSIGQLGALVGLGATAGLAGSILSLRRERLGRTAETSPRDA